ncbi:hypothetical protein K461DRAFT_154321 [Myriangium duriaei CBS 260.36]|uniref:Uncharacterized protein n=1 Tax=Myriangium duriaei CBS 260.36 TaxID=1168546 RepID=A0A9P4IXA8_9PEZI|nr:hypothetical protein K461DRAFT_154321 [Myriangium duriaei CBS 260.36]
MPEAHWLMLDPLSYIEGNRWDRFLGAVVKNPLNPTENRAPDDPAEFGTSRLAETTFDRFAYQNASLQANANEFSLQGLGRFRRTTKTQHGLDLSGRTIQIKRLEQHDQLWEVLMRNEQFRVTIATWIDERRQCFRRKNIVCWIVGVLICEDPHVRLTTHKNGGTEVGGGVPLGTLLETGALTQGVVVPTGGVGNLDIGWNRGHALEKDLRGQASGSRIFAIELKWVKSKDRLPGDQPRIDRRLATDNIDPTDLINEDVPNEVWDLLQTEDEAADQVVDEKWPSIRRQLGRNHGDSDDESVGTEEESEEEDLENQVE